MPDDFNDRAPWNAAPTRWMHHGSATPAASLSIVVPLRDEASNVRLLVDAVCDALRGYDGWELLLVDDGSEDGTLAVADELAADDARVRVIPLARNYGQSAAMQAGFDQAEGEVVITMDGDLQNDPRDIPRLVAKLAEGYDLVTGYRKSRQDAWLTRRVPSWIANQLIRWTTGVQVRDIGCSLRAYRRELIAGVHLYSDLHRFLPALAVATTGARIAEIPVRHHPRRLGRSKYGLSRIIKVQLDLLTLKMIRNFRERPLLMFAVMSTGAALISGLFLLSAAIAPPSDRSLGWNSLVFESAALLWLSLACYLLLVGLLGELALLHQRQRSVTLPILREELP